MFNLPEYLQLHLSFKMIYTRKIGSKISFESPELNVISTIEMVYNRHCSYGPRVADIVN